MWVSKKVEIIKEKTHQGVKEEDSGIDLGDLGDQLNVNMTSS